MDEETDLAPELETDPLACATHGWEAFRQEFGLLLVIGFGVHAASICVISMFSGGELAAWGLLLAVLFTRPLRWGFAYLCLRPVRDEDAEPADAMASFHRYRDVVIANAVVLFMVIVGISMFVIPGVFIHLRTRFVPYLILDEGLGPMSAIRESFELTEGVALKILAINAGGWAGVILGVIPFGLGICPALILWDLTLTSLYQAVLEREEAVELDDAVPEVGHGHRAAM